MERFHIDNLGPWFETPRGNQYVFVVADQFSKWVKCYAHSDHTAEKVASTLVTYFCQTRMTSKLHNDQGRLICLRIIT